MLGDGDGVLGELFEPAFGLLGVAVVGAELGQEDAVGVAHAVDGGLGVLVEGEGLGELEAEGGGIDGVFAGDLFADGEGGFEPDAGFVVVLEVLQHHGGVVDGGDGVGVFEAVDDFPELEGMLDVDEGDFGVAVGVLEEGEVEVAEDCFVGVETEGALGDDHGLAGELDGCRLLVELVVEHGELVVDACDFGVENAIYLLVEG